MNACLNDKINITVYNIMYKIIDNITENDLNLKINCWNDMKGEFARSVPI